MTDSTDGSLPDIQDEDLVRLLTQGDPRAFFEFVRRFGPLIGVINNRINGSWISQDTLKDATWKVLDNVARSLSAETDLGSRRVKNLVIDWAETYAVLLWRARHTPD